MSSASSFRRWALVVSAASLVGVGACATSDETMGGTQGECPYPPCTLDDGGGSGGKKDSSPSTGDDDSGSTGDDDSGSTGDDDSSTGNDPDTSTGGGDTGGGNQGDASGSGWVDMTNNPAACEQKTGALCGWSATNNGSGATCACRHGTWAEGWTCEAPGSPTTAGPSCPGVVTSDAGAADTSTASDTGTLADTSVGTDSSVTGWVDMDNNPTGCDQKKGVPCGWNPTNNGAGYTCACRRGTWADGWTCEAANAPVTPGPSCP